jgi:hypothetical protein
VRGIEEHREGSHLHHADVEDGRAPALADDLCQRQPPGHPIDAQPVGLVVSLGEGSVDHPARKRIPLHAGQPGEELRPSVARLPGVVGDAAQLVIVHALSQPAERAEALDHAARVSHRYRPVGVAVEHDHLLVRGVFGQGEGPGQGEQALVVKGALRRRDGPLGVRHGAHRNDRREQIGIAEAEVPGAAAAHRQTGEVNAIGVDVVGPAHVGDHLQDVALSQAVKPHQLAARQRRHRDHRHVGQRHLVA